jgi:hypothetical protein
VDEDDSALNATDLALALQARAVGLRTVHHFETPVVHEARARAHTNEERDDGDDAGAEQRRPQEREVEDYAAAADIRAT